MVAEAEADNVKNKEKLEKINAKNTLDSTINQVEKFIKENESADSSDLQTALQNSKDVFGNESASLDEITKSQESLMEKFQELGTKMHEQAQANPTETSVNMTDENVMDAELVD
jgi:hypothetical protein